MSVTGTGACAQDTQTIAGIGAEAAQNGFLWPNQPNIIDFAWWLSANVEIPAAALPASSPWPGYALASALGLVLIIPCVPAIQYTLAVYNCATHILMGMAPDQPGNNFFTAARANSGYSLVNPSTGIVAASSDASTSSTLASPDWAKGMTVSDLGFFKTPWGREYLMFNQSYGPTIIGLT